ncbi:MAG: ubiquinol-cytochrome c reductase cytochrome b subunit [Micromonosporaceae bacterium]|nr:ubiquinol-cytochrome c reductase cytochrome b subunit [Micromonosporaceae bacterium]
MQLRRFYRVVDDRVGTSTVLRKALAKVFPDHWTFMFGEIALYSFITLILTGLFLTLFFVPSTAETTYQGVYEPLAGTEISAAFASTVSLSFDVRAGLLFRQAHHWSALIFIAAIVMHLLRIFFTAAYRRPREINWLIGVTMLALALLNGFTGYSMPDDLLSGTGLRIIYSVILSIPLLGPWLAFLIFGGEFPGDAIVPRLFITHVFLVPAALVVLISAHLAIVVRQKHSQFPGPGRGESNTVGSRFWPAYTMRTIALFAAVLAVAFALGGVAQINPVWIYGPYGPAQATSPAQPDWYVAWGDGALRLFPPVEFTVFGYLVPAPFLPGVVVGGLIFVLLYAWPFIDRRLSRDTATHELLQRPRDHPVRVAIGAGSLAFLAILLIAAVDDVIARFTHLPVVAVLWVLRVLALLLPFVVGAVAYAITRSVRDRSAPDPEPTAASPPAQRGEQPEPAGIDLWHNRLNETWRWRWRGREGRELISHVAFLDRDSAVAGAQLAYPDTPIDDVTPPPTPPRPITGRAGSALLAIALLAIGRRRRGNGRRTGR